MTMLRKCLAAVGALAALAWIGAARADEPTSGAASVDAPTITLQGDGQADTELVKGFHGGGFHGGGFHGGGFHGGYHGGYHGGFHGGYHVGHYGHHHGGWGGYYAGYYRPWYYGYSSYYYPSYSYASYYAPSYCYTPYYSMPYAYSYYPAAYSYVGYTPATVAVTYATNGTAANTVPTVPLNQQYYMPPATSGPATNGSASFPGPGGTPIYDGGPANLVPMPQDVPTPQKGVAAPQAPKGYPVSITGPVQNSGHTFPAFGETSTTPAPKTATPAGNFAFPAYGEQSKTSNFASGGN